MYACIMCALFAAGLLPPHDVERLLPTMLDGSVVESATLPAFDVFGGMCGSVLGVSFV